MLVLFTHPWTWGILVSIVGLFFILSIFNLVLKRKEENMLFTFSILIVSFLMVLLMFFSKINLAMFNEFLSSYQEIMPSISLSYLLKLNKTLTHTLIGYVGGFLMNPILFILAILGLFGIRDLKNEFNRMIFSWMAITSIGALLVNSWFQWRLFYLMPLPILAALGVNLILESINKLYSMLNKEFLENLKYVKIIHWLFMILIGISMLNYAFRSMYYLFASPNLFWA
jgi:hypothetical protein